MCKEKCLQANMFEKDRHQVQKMHGIVQQWCYGQLLLGWCKQLSPDLVHLFLP